MNFSDESSLLSFLQAQLGNDIGDDCGYWPDSDQPDWLLTTDTLAEGIHFDSAYEPEDVARKLWGVNLSDVAAMGGSPSHALLNYTGDPSSDWAETFLTTLIEITNDQEVPLVGGDTTRSQSGDTVVSLTLVAQPHPEGLLRRSAGEPGDQLAVTGSLGGAGASWNQAPETRSDKLQKLLSEPPNRLLDGQALVREGVRSGIDLSDGLVKDLNRLLSASELGARVDWTQIPIHPQAQQQAVSSHQALEWALTAGEDFELLCALPSEISPESFGMTPIGTLTEEPGLHWEPALPEELPDDLDGYDHFKHPEA